MSNGGPSPFPILVWLVDGDKAHELAEVAATAAGDCRCKRRDVPRICYGLSPVGYRVSSASTIVLVASRAPDRASAVLAWLAGVKAVGSLPAASIDAPTAAMTS